MQEGYCVCRIGYALLLLVKRLCLVNRHSLYDRLRLTTSGAQVDKRVI